MDSNHERLRYMLKLASCALRKAGDELGSLRRDNEKLSSEICRLNKKMDDTNKFEETLKLAERLHDRGLIKKADIEAKAAEMMDFDENALKVVELSLSNTESQKIASADNGVSSLSDFYYDENSMEDPMAAVFRHSMAESIIKLANQI